MFFCWENVLSLNQTPYDKVVLACQVWLLMGSKVTIDGSSRLTYLFLGFQPRTMFMVAWWPWPTVVVVVCGPNAIMASYIDLADIGEQDGEIEVVRARCLTRAMAFKRFSRYALETPFL